MKPRIHKRHSRRTADVNVDGIPVRCAFKEMVALEKLVPNPRNPNKHGQEQIAVLAKVIRYQGWRAPVVVSLRSGFIVAGEGRYHAAKLLKAATVPVDYQDFASEADEWAHLIADNRIAELAQPDLVELAKMLDELNGQLEIALTGFTEEAARELARISAKMGTEQQPALEPATGELLKLVDVAVGEPKTTVEPGDVWAAGDHVVICADVFTQWAGWMKYLKGTALFLPYANPLVLVTERSRQQTFVVVNPDPYLCGHMLDKFIGMTGTKVRKRGRIQ